MEKVTDCLEYLISTDDEYGELRGHVKGLEHRLKVAKAMAYIETSPDQAVAMRESLALTSETYKNALETYENAVVEMETIAAKRKSRELTIEVWRSQNANKRSGNI